MFENNYASHFVNKHTCIQGLSREGKSEEGIKKTSCITSSTLVPMQAFLCHHTMHVKLLVVHFLFTSPLIPFKYCYFFCRLNQTHFIGMEIRKNLNKCVIQGAHNPDNVYNLTHFHSFILRFFNETSSKIHLQKLGLVHRGSPWTGYMKGSMD